MKACKGEELGSHSHPGNPGHPWVASCVLRTTWEAGPLFTHFAALLLGGTSCLCDNLDIYLTGGSSLTPEVFQAQNTEQTGAGSTPGASARPVDTAGLATEGCVPGSPAVWLWVTDAPETPAYKRRGGGWCQMTGSAAPGSME